MSTPQRLQDAGAELVQVVHALGPEIADKASVELVFELSRLANLLQRHALRLSDVQQELEDLGRLELERL